MKKYLVTANFITPYLQDRMDDISLDEWEKLRGKIIERKDIALPDYKRALFACYMNGNNEHFFPAEHLRGALINAGGYMKSKVGNSRKSMKNIVAAMFFVHPHKIVISEFDTIDKRSVVNNHAKARIIKIRPQWTNLKLKFELHIDNDTITDETVKELLDYAGRYCGVGSFRPTNNGMFGRFECKLKAA